MMERKFVFVLEGLHATYDALDFYLKCVSSPDSRFAVHLFGYDVGY